ncbi:uncharacterized protein ARMOST_19497 [Armillaria ostoyae]|uniref:Heterokaryon incompatibility domain-containing protein n=1 Tax=Armillaria ostoyae TaxID=47428 RepID=A0A284S4Q1_ARMOS|nr:uncharacterized protein ARMOST_19497 [Armillaria ostoyae]
MLAPSRIPSHLIKSIWKRFRSIFTTPQTPEDSTPSIAALSGQNANMIAPSEPQGEIVHPNISSTSDDGEPILETISNSSSDVQPELSSASLVAGSPIDSVDEQSASVSVSVSDNGNYYVRNYRKKWGITLPRVTISAFTETGQVESAIKVPKQRSYTALGILGVLDRMNATLGTSHTLDTPSVLSLLEECIEKNYDFGMVYGHLRMVWNTDRDSNMKDKLRRHEEKDRKMRQEALVGNVIVNPQLEPRRVWDLYSNRVVPYWIAEKSPDPISHAWVDEEDRVDVWTPINGNEWPVPIPKDTSLDLIRIEMLNLDVEYTWLDVLCLRQKGGPREDLRAEEWKLDVPTIGNIYRMIQVVVYLSGLGWPLSLKEGDLDSDLCWFRRAWTVQEVGISKRIIAGDTPNGPMYAEPVDDDGNYKTGMLTRFHKKLNSLHTNDDIFSVLTAMQDRVLTNRIDRVAGLAQPMVPSTIPAYYESGSLEDAWTALVNTTHQFDHALLLFQYPGFGLGCKKWRPTWEQVMTEPLPAFVDYFGGVQHDNETDEDWVDGLCIEKGLLRGLDMGSAEGVDRCGQLEVKDVDGTSHTFKICVTHQIPIPEDVYVLLRIQDPWHDKFNKQIYWAVGRRMPDQRFEKVSMFMMDNSKEVTGLADLQGVMVKSRNVLA